MATATGGDTMATSSVVSDKFTVTHGLVGALENTKVSVGSLYLLRHILAEPRANQSDVIEPSATTGLGKIGESNLAIYDGTDSEANLVANGQGMYTYAGNWNNWFTLVFKVERFKGSTLQVMGASAPDDKENEWAIVGGTGEFAMARGTIKRQAYSFIGSTTIHELTMEFFCRMIPAPTKRGPWGGNGGSLCEMVGKSQRLESVTINHGGVVHAIEFSYIDQNGRMNKSGIWGQLLATSADKMKMIKFGPSEFVKQIAGAGVRGTAPPVYLTKFRITTNKRTYGPFGANAGDNSFIYAVPEGETVVGFFANISDGVHKIGLYTI